MPQQTELRSWQAMLYTRVVLSSVCGSVDRVPFHHHLPHIFRFPLRFRLSFGDFSMSCLCRAWTSCLPRVPPTGCWDPSTLRPSPPPSSRLQGSSSGPAATTRSQAWRVLSRRRPRCMGMAASGGRCCRCRPRASWRVSVCASNAHMPVQTSAQLGDGCSKLHSVHMNTETA